MAEKSTASQRLTQLNSQIPAPIIPDDQNPKKSLEEYRSKSTLDPKVINMLIYGYNAHHRIKTFEVIRKYPNIFRHTHLEEMNRETARYLAFRQLVLFNQEGNIPYEEYKKDPHITTIIGTAMYQWNPAHSIKHGVAFYLFAKTIMNLGTQKHEKLIERALKFDDIGCFALTELGHGSNAKAIQTTATYDSATNEFIIHTPNDMALKWWIGASAELANYSAVWAQLYVNGKHEGVHAFVVPIRSTRDHLPLPGVVIGDCGSKVGLQGIDNGFIQFNYYRVPYDSLLDKLSSIENGVYKTSILNADRRFGLQLGSLSGGRISVSFHANSAAMLGLTIGIRYACVRKQFGLPKQPELSIIEYPLVQHRLMVCMAQYVVAQIATLKLNQVWDSNQSKVLDLGNNLINQLHAQSSVMKPITSWQSAKAIQVAREVLGGHGYSSLNRLGALYNDNDINVTWEGDNTVLLQQTAKFLLEGIRHVMKGKPCKYDTIAFISVEPAEGQTWEATNVEEFRNPEFLIHALEWRVNLLLQRSGMKLQENMEKEGDSFTAWNATQVYFLNNLALAYGDVYQAQELIAAYKTVTHEPTKVFLLNVFELWTLNAIITDLGTFREGDFVSSDIAKLAKDRILDLIKLLKDEAVGLFDVVAPPDFAVGSPFGASDGDIYNRYLNLVRGSKDCYGRVKWWNEIHPTEN